MIRKDGTYTIYRLEHEQKDGKWTSSSLDHFGYPPGFDAGGECWQTTGITGVLNYEEAVAGLHYLCDKHRGQAFRIAVVKITQVTHVGALMMFSKEEL
jgi:hypothetical protein